MFSPLGVKPHSLGAAQECQIWLAEPKCTETDLKMSEICPIWSQSDPIWMPNLTYLVLWWFVSTSWSSYYQLAFMLRSFFILWHLSTGPDRSCNPLFNCFRCIHCMLFSIHVAFCPCGYSLYFINSLCSALKEFIYWSRDLGFGFLKIGPVINAIGSY